MSKRAITIQYLIFDYITSSIAWFLFFIFRKHVIEEEPVIDYAIILEDSHFWYGTLILPILWIALYTINGFYFKVYHKSRLAEFIQTFWICLLGTLIIFFVLLIDDKIPGGYKMYYKSISALFLLQFLLNYIPKFVITSSTAHKIHRRKIGFNTLLIGQGDKAISLHQELSSAPRSAGYQFKGYLTLDGIHNSDPFVGKLKHLGNIDTIKVAIEQLGIEEIILALEDAEIEKVNELISILQEFDVGIRMKAEMHNILKGQVKMNSIFHAALIEINFDSIPSWQKFAKRLFDIVVSITVLTLLSPLYSFVAAGVKFSSKGPIFFRQERIGKNGKKFNIIKFRSMYCDSEISGPQLSSKNDKRITSFGEFIRKYRLDEIPQFFNVLKGEMSIVGPRPERQYFIDKICEQAPQYKFLYKIKPGITSWGQVKYGYAENVDEMIDRLNFDLIYLENRSLLVDIKIMIYTVLVIVQGKGK